MPEANGHAPKAPFVVFAIPTLTHSVGVEFFLSFLAADQLLASKGIDRAYILVGGDQFIAKARNKLVADALKDFPQWTDLFFLDDDLGFTPQKVLEFVLRDELVLAGVYPKKNKHNEWPSQLCLDKAGGTGRLVERNGLFKADSAPAGFMRIKRRVIDDLVAQVAKYQEPNPDGVMEDRWNIFEAGVTNGGFVTEDVIFCQKWRDLCDGEVWVDPCIAFAHRGAQVWNGSFIDMINGFVQANPDRAPPHLLVDGKPNLSALVPQGAA